MLNDNSSSHHLPIYTHTKINQGLCGTVTLLEENRACVVLHTTQEMVSDEFGLIHGGFTFGGADYAAMVLVNDPNVVLVGASTRFLAPVKVGQSITFEATTRHTTGKKRDVHVIATVDGIKVFEGDFTTVTLEQHVLKMKLA